MNRFRFRLLVYPKFQLALIAVNLGVMVASLGVVFYQLQRAFNRLSTMGGDLKIPADHAYYKFLNWQASQIHSYLFIAFAVGFVLSTVTTLTLSNRLAGPIIRLREYFRGVAAARKITGPIAFRKKDFFPDLPALINEALAEVTGKQSNEDEGSHGSQKKAA